MEGFLPQRRSLRDHEADRTGPYKDGIVEEIIPEPVGGAQRSHAALFAAMDTALKNHLTALCKMSGKALADQRYKKFRQIGEAKRA